jgi:hypothetical protein
MNNKLLVGVIVVVLVICSFYIGNTINTRTVIQEKLGAVAGPDVMSYLKVHGTLTTNGGYMATTSTAATYTLLNSEIADAQTVFWNPSANVTLTLPASTTISFIPNTGDTRVIWLQNASTTAGATITLAAGAGIDLQKNEDTADLAVAGLDWVKMTFIRKNNTDIAVMLEEVTEAD